MKSWAIGLIVILFACFGCASAARVPGYDGVPEISADSDAVASSVKVFIRNEKFEDATFYVLTSSGARSYTLGRFAGKSEHSFWVARSNFPADPCIRIGAHITGYSDWVSEPFCLYRGAQIRVGLSTDNPYAWTGGK